MRSVTRSLPLAILALLLAAPRATAADDTIAWASSWKDAVAEAKERGAKILIVLIWDGNDDADNVSQGDVYRTDKDVAKAAAKFVCLFACQSTNHGEERVKEGGREVLRCRICKTIPCSVHKKVEGFVAGRFGELFIDDNGDVRTPIQFLVDVDGKVLETLANGDKAGGFGVVTGPDLAGRLNAAAAKYGAGLDRAKIERFKKDLVEGEELLAKKRFAKAAETFYGIVEGAPKGMSIVATAKKRLAEIGAMGQGGIDEGRALAAKKEYADAIARLERVAKEFAHTPAADEAKKAIEEIRADPAYEAQEAKGESEKLLADARKLEKRRKWKQALALYDACAKAHPATEAGAAAKKRAAEIRADEELMGQILEEAATKDCRRWLSTANNYIRAGKPELAKTYLKKIIDKYPGTSWATKAKKLLAGL